MDLVTASVAAARHCRLVESHGLWANLSATTIAITVDESTQSESVSSGVCASTSESTCTCAHVSVLSDGRGVHVLPVSYTLTLSESTLCENVDSLCVSISSSFGSTETRLACLVHTPADSNDTEKSGTTETSGKTDACCSHSVSAVSVAITASVTVEVSCA